MFAQTVCCCQNVGGSGLVICRNVEEWGDFLCVFLVLNGGLKGDNLGLQESVRELSPCCEDSHWRQRAFPHSSSQTESPIAWTTCMPVSHKAKCPRSCTHSVVGTKW